MPKKSLKQSVDERVAKAAAEITAVFESLEFTSEHFAKEPVIDEKLIRRLTKKMGKKLFGREKKIKLGKAAKDLLKEKFNEHQKIKDK